jgi:AbrB family looped-hinge helix DNA binding protein
MALELTRLSGKGQIVIPTEMRRRMGLSEGTKFLVIGLEDTIILRKLQVSEEKLRLKQLLAEARVSAKKHGLSEREIERLVHAVRKVSE